MVKVGVGLWEILVSSASEDKKCQKKKELPIKKNVMH